MDSYANNPQPRGRIFVFRLSARRAGWLARLLVPAALLAQSGITAVLCLAVYAVRGNVVELFRMTETDSGGSWLVRFLRRSCDDSPAPR